MMTCSQAGHPKPSLHATVPLGAERGVLSRDIKPVTRVLWLQDLGSEMQGMCRLCLSRGYHVFASLERSQGALPAWSRPGCLQSGAGGG